MRFRWSVAAPQPLLAGQLANQLRISPLLAQCLLNRGFDEPGIISGFLEPRLRNLSDPFLLPNMPAAVERLFRAREQSEPVVIFGDYDVDGVTSTALLLEVLGRLGWHVDYYLPHRLEEGYGLSQDAIENCRRKFSATLWLAVDCGSTSVASIAWLRERGVEVIVLDHHQVSNPEPAAVALVNPQLRLLKERASGSLASPLAANGATPEPFTELCSVGLAFKLAHAVVKQGRQTGLPGSQDLDLRPLLDLVALGTIADLVPLTGENRILVSAGLERLSRTQRPGLVGLKQVAGCTMSAGSYEAGFQLAPRLNAAGRLETAQEALQLLRARDMAEAMPLALKLDAHNRERQRIERGIAEEAIELVQAKFDPANDFAIVQGNLSWHVGVVGIVAARVVQRFYRPTLIVGGEGETLRGSGRSIVGFDLAAALRQCDDLLVRHGGHAMAAGVSLLPEKLDAFRERLNELARQALNSDQLEPQLSLDAEVGLDELTLDALAVLGRLKPAGQGNPAVRFFAKGLSHQRPLQRLGPEKQHVKMWVSDGTTVHEALWWGGGNDPLPVGQFDLAFEPQMHQYNGRRSVQLRVLDWRGGM
jgi:single-stranded-DNA-specific exonuclease